MKNNHLLVETQEFLHIITIAMENMALSIDEYEQLESIAESVRIRSLLHFESPVNDYGR